MEKWTSSPPGNTEHLEPEILAAFLDGQLGEDENRQVRRHLAECEECDLVFVATVEFLRGEKQRDAVEQGNVFPFAEPDPPVPARAPRKDWRGRVAVAATVALAMGAGFLGYRAFEAPAITPSGVEVQALPAPDADRGSSDLPDELAALTLGTQQQALAERVAQKADTTELVKSMASVISRTPSLKELRDDLNEPDAAGRLLEADLRGKLDTPQWFDLGELAAVGRAAARARQEDPLRGSWDGFKFGRRLSRLLRQKSGKLDTRTLEHLGKIEELREARELDFAALEEELDALLKCADPTASPCGSL